MTMEEIPAAIGRFLQALASGTRSPAWLRVDGAQNVSALGGALAAYGLDAIAIGSPADQLDFLHGLLPLNGVPFTSPCMMTATTGFADLHLIPDIDGDWALFLDAAEEAQRRQALQQKINDLALVQQREAKALALLEAEQIKSDRLLLSLFPRAIAERLKRDESACIAEEYQNVTILFADIHDFWSVAGSLSPPGLIDLLNDVFSLFDKLADAHGVQKIKTIGDAYMAAAGVPNPRTDHAHAIADFALSIQREIASLRTRGANPFDVRIGIHSGSVVAGVVGVRRQAYDLWGPTVNLASQMESSGLPGAIQVSSATHELLKDRYRFEPRGEFYVNGQGSVETYLLWGRGPG